MILIVFMSIGITYSTSVSTVNDFIYDFDNVFTYESGMEIIRACQMYYVGQILVERVNIYLRKSNLAF